MVALKLKNDKKSMNKLGISLIFDPKKVICIEESIFYIFFIGKSDFLGPRAPRAPKN